MSTKSNKAGNKSFFLISFLPALAYWYLEANYSLQTALIGGVILALIEMALEWIFTRHIHTISKFNFFLIAVLGGLSYFASDGIWFKLQPFFTGVIMGGYLLYRNLIDKSVMYEIVEIMNPEVPKPFFMMLEKNISIFTIIYGIFMAFVAFSMETDWWLFFKTGGFYIATAIFMVAQILYIRLKVRSR